MSADAIQTKIVPYDAYGASQVPWIDTVPVGWRAIRLDRLFRYRSEEPQEGDGRVTGYLDGRVTLRSNVAGQKIKGVVHETGWQRIHVGDFAISGMNAHLGGMGVSDSEGKCSPIYLILEPLPDTNAHFVSLAVRHAAQLGAIKALVQTIRFNSADMKRADLKSIYVPVPSIAEQEQIVRFVHHLDSKVNRLIKAKRRLIELLNEQKQAIIHRAVTRGLNPTAPLTPSGIDWLGDVPEHWKVKRIRTCLSGYTAGVWGAEPEESNQGDHIVCLRVADFDMNSLSVKVDKLTMRAIPSAARTPRLLKKGDILMEKSGGGEAEPVGRAVYFDLDIAAVTSNFVTRIRTDDSILEPRFLLMTMAFLQSSRRNVPSIKQTTGIQNLDEKHYFSTFIGIPPLREQSLILEALDSDLIGLRSAIDQVRAEIDLIREYRTRLVADVVTGQLDVRHVELSDLGTNVSAEALDDDYADEDEEPELTEVM